MVPTYVGGHHLTKPTSPASDSTHAEFIGPRVELSKRTPQPCELHHSAEGVAASNAQASDLIQAFKPSERAMLFR